jgi:hypothetical protein
MNDMNLEAASYALQCWSARGYINATKYAGRRVQGGSLSWQYKDASIYQRTSKTYKYRDPLLESEVWTIWWDVGASGSTTRLAAGMSSAFGVRVSGWKLWKPRLKMQTIYLTRTVADRSKKSNATSKRLAVTLGGVCGQFGEIDLVTATRGHRNQVCETMDT